METDVHLSVLITQWGKLDWLEACLRSIARQLPLRGIEIVIGDDGERTEHHGPPLGGASREETIQVIERTMGEHVRDVKYARWPEDVPKTTMHNLARTLPLASGEWIWVIGNNDLVFRWALHHVLQTIPLLDDAVSYLSFNYHGYHTEKGSPPPFDPESVAATECWDFFRADSYFPRLAEIALKDWHNHTAIYSGAMRRRDWMKVASIFYAGVHRKDPRWKDMTTTCPYTYWILAELLEKPVYYISLPMVLMNYDSTWKVEPGADNWHNMLRDIRKEMKWRIESLYKRLNLRPPQDPRPNRDL